MNAKAQESSPSQRVLSAATGDPRLFALVRMFDANFHCMIGPPRAYFEIPGEREEQLTRVIYQTFKIATPEDTPESRDHLVDFMWKEYFKPVVDRLTELQPDRLPEDNVLFWRKLPAFEPAGSGLALRLRLAIPGIRIPGEVQL